MVGGTPRGTVVASAIGSSAIALLLCAVVYLQTGAQVGGVRTYDAAILPPRVPIRDVWVGAGRAVKMEVQFFFHLDRLGIVYDTGAARETARRLHQMSF